MAKKTRSYRAFSKLSDTLRKALHRNLSTQDKMRHKVITHDAAVWAVGLAFKPGCD
ncbi:hypothetical protein [Klebsiella grimontii]|uniref:hypothetical protein n=1 Tax=Klebsiella grimontii TaxID=2058152 RepID=UPI0015AFAE4A|nr:hypothetical protein [Klebsiella grimontii]